jgi:hypothetical protein
MSAYATASSHLALLSDLALERMVGQAPQVRPGIGGTSARLEVEGVQVFVKQVPVTERELLPGNLRSTANLFGLPGFYQYGLGSAGFGAWRELAAHIMTTNWVLSDEHRAFALLYHWRVLPGPVATEGVFAEFGGLDGAVAHWDGSAAVRDRLQGLRHSPSRLVLFLEHVPQTLAAWMADQDVSAFAWVDAQLADTTAFMREHGLAHFDAHFLNILTDGHALYFSDFGLALSDRFDLSDQERAFLREHRAVCSVTGSQVDHADVGQSVEHQLHPERSQQETEHLLGDQHPARVQLAADLHCPAEDGDIERENGDKHTDGYGEHRDRTGLCRQGDQDDDPGRVEQVGHGQREDSDLRRVPAFYRMVAAASGLMAKHHGYSDDQQDDAASYAQRTRREMQQPG